MGLGQLQVKSGLNQPLLGLKQIRTRSYDRSSAR